jgi:TolA-binding protein
VKIRGRCAAWALLVAALPLPAQHEPPTPKAESHQTASKPSSGAMTDAQAGELAKEALGAENPASIRAVLARLKAHTFKSSKVPERELVLFAQGMLEARLGNTSAASLALKKLEKQWPKSPFMGEANTVLAEDAVAQKRYKEAEGRLHQALGADMPSELKRKPQELLIWILVEQGRSQEALPIVKSLQPLEAKAKPSEKGLAAIVEVLSSAGMREQAQGGRKDFLSLYPSSELMPRVELAWGRLLGRSGEAKDSAIVLRKLIKDFPKSPQADDARLDLASLLTSGTLHDIKDMPSAESLLAEVRKGGKGLPKGPAQIVELRLLNGKMLWEDALNAVDRMDPSLREGPSEVKKLWTEAWQAWVGQRLEKAFPGELLTRMKAGAFAALDAKLRLGVVELLATQGLSEVLPQLLSEAPVSERNTLRKAALAKIQPEAQAQAILQLLPAKGASPDEALMRARAEAALGQWPALRISLGRARPGAERIRTLLSLLQRPRAKGEPDSQRLAEAEGWLARAPEKGAIREPLMILVADLRLQQGNLQGALAMYPAKAAAAEQRGWVALMRAEALVKLGKRDQARTVILAAREEPGFKGQRDILAKSLGAY